MSEMSKPEASARPQLRLRSQNGESGGRAWPVAGKERKENMGAIEAWASVAAGAGLVWCAWRCWSKASIPLAVVGATLLYRGSTRCYLFYSAAGADRTKGRSGPDAVSMVTINAPAEEVYSFWRDLSNAPRFMTIMDRVDVLDDKRSRWRSREIGGHSFDYETEIVDDTPNHGFRWRSIEGEPLEMRGAVRFKRAPGGRGTIVIASVVFGPDEGESLRSKVAKPFANYVMHQDLMRLKQLLEAGEIATTEGQPVGQAPHEAPSHPPRAHEQGRTVRTYEYGAIRS